MVRRFAVAAVVFSGMTLLAPPAHAADSSALCSVAGTVASTPGVGYAPQSGTYELKGTLDCQSGAQKHGEMTGTGTGTIGCIGGSSIAALKVDWGGGKTSTMKVQLGDFLYGTGGYGTVEDGEFKGAHVGLGWGREAAGAEMQCATGGVKSYEIAGGMMFG
ncbi:MAG TPA: hypothetical protein VG034_13530 [Acidimicrobiia bacterium]|jgi:hypothetical protein|nr:hypothetical protein [Acidimicrobiia bacterium]